MLGLGLSLNKSTLVKQIKLEKLVSDAGGVLYLDARKATGTQPPINSPLTQTWVDLSGNNNNAIEKNMTGTITSGVGGTTNLPLWMFDGIDDRFDLVNSTSLDLTTAPLAVFATLKTGSTFTNEYIFAKNTDSSANIQYGFYITSTAGMSVFLEGQQRAYIGNNQLQANKIYNIGFIWDGTNVKPYLNYQIANGSIGNYTGTLTSGRINVRIGCRVNTGGVNSVFFNSGIATITIYTGIKAIETNVLKAEKAISKAYLVT